MNMTRNGARMVAAAVIVVPLLFGAAFAAQADDADAAPAYAAKSTGTRDLVAGDVRIRMLLEASNLGDAGVELGELTMPAGYSGSGAHAHASLEIFYVVEGVLGHEVNGRRYELHPGEVGFVKPGDEVRHSVLSPGPVRTLVIWVPGGEADRLVEHAGFAVQPRP